MTRGSEGPYLNEEGDIWVPMTVPWRDARRVAAGGIQEYDRYPKYVGTERTRLLGFTRDCFCEERCEMTIEDADDYDPALKEACRVLAWHFVETERKGVPR